MCYLFFVVGRISRTLSAEVGSRVDDLSNSSYDRNSICSFTYGGKLQMANPTAPDLNAPHCCIEGV